MQQYFRDKSLDEGTCTELKALLDTRARIERTITRLQGEIEQKQTEVEQKIANLPS